MAGEKSATAELEEALGALVHQDVSYQGNRIVIECDSHVDAIQRVRNARQALARSQGK